MAPPSQEAPGAIARQVLRGEEGRPPGATSPFRGPPRPDRQLGASLRTYPHFPQQLPRHYPISTDAVNRLQTMAYNMPPHRPTAPPAVRLVDKHRNSFPTHAL